MDEGRPLTDAELDRQIEAAFVVEPSPEFLARVRQRVGEEPPAVLWGSRRVGALAVAAAIVVAAVWNWPEREQVAPVSTGAPRVATTEPLEPATSSDVANADGTGRPSAPPTKGARGARGLPVRAASRETVRATAGDWDERFAAVVLAENEREAIRWFGAATRTPLREPAPITVSAERAPEEEPALGFVNLESPDLARPVFESVRLE